MKTCQKKKVQAKQTNQNKYKTRFVGIYQGQKDK